MQNRLLFLVSLLLPMFVHAVEFGPRKFPERTHTAIMGAFEPELAAITSAIEHHPEGAIEQVVSIKGVPYHLGRYRGEPVVIFATGISIANAAMTTQMALDYFPIKRVIFAGIAGGINPELAKGDVVIPERWYYHDEVVYLNHDENGHPIYPEYFEDEAWYIEENRPDLPHLPNYQNFGMIYPDDVMVVKEGVKTPQTMPYFQPDAALLATARQAVNKLQPLSRALGGEALVLVGGNGVTGSVFIDNRDYRRWLFEVYEASAVEMESAAIGQVCYVNEIPWLIIRALSDLAGGQQGQNEEEQYMHAASKNATVVTLAVLDELTQASVNQ